MSRLLLIRHGHAPTRGVSDDSLSAPGRLQVERLGTRLAAERLRVDELLASPLPRAWETAERLCGPLGFARPTIEPEVAERPEAWPELRDRAPQLMERLHAAHPTATVAVVTHASIILATTFALLDVPRPGRGAYLLEPANASITEWSHDTTGWTLERYNDRAHLPPHRAARH